MHQLVAAYFGYKGGDSKAAISKETQDQMIADLLATMPPLPDHMKLNIPKAAPWPIKTSNTA